jgi:hypothetical protein
MSLVYTDKTHTYTLDGVIVPSVTQIIGEWIDADIYGTMYKVNVYSGVAVLADKFTAPAEFGRAIHKAAYLILTGQGLNWGKIDSALVPPVKQFQKWMLDHNVIPVLSEVPMASRKYGYAGTPDIFCYLDKKLKRLCLVDIKTGEYDMAGAQTAAYEPLYREHTGFRGMIDRYVLHLPKDGSSYKFFKLENRQDWHFFMSKLMEYKYTAHLRKAA